MCPSPRDPAAASLGQLELAALRALWGAAPASVRDVLERINGERAEPLAYTSVLTVLDRLHDKGLVERERDGRAWAYTPSHPHERALVDHLGRREVEDLVDRFGDVALVHFAATLYELDPATRAALEELAAGDDG